MSEETHTTAPLALSADGKYGHRDWTATDLVGIGFASRSTVYRLVNTGALRAFKIGRVTRIKGASVDDFINNHRWPEDAA